jgi:phosphocarrier protein HPr
MATARVTICNKKGLHARAAAKLVKTAAGFNAEIQVVRPLLPGEKGVAPSAGATSILSLLMLAAEMGVDVELHGQGPEAEAAIEALKALISRRFDEEE